MLLWKYMKFKHIREDVLNFLNAHRKAVVGITSEGQPSGSLMLYVIDDDLNFFLGTRKSFIKYDRLQENPNVSLVVVEEGIDPLRVVQVQGKVEFISEENTEKTLKFFELKNPSKYYVKDAPDFVMFKVTPARIRWVDASSGELVTHNIECKT